MFPSDIEQERFELKVIREAADLIAKGQAEAARGMLITLSNLKTDRLIQGEREMIRALTQDTDHERSRQTEAEEKSYIEGTGDADADDIPF